MDDRYTVSHTVGERHALLRLLLRCHDQCHGGTVTCWWVHLSVQSSLGSSLISSTNHAMEGEGSCCSKTTTTIRRSAPLQWQWSDQTVEEYNHENELCIHVPSDGQCAVLWEWHAGGETKVHCGLVCEQSHWTTIVLYCTIVDCM